MAIEICMLLSGKVFILELTQCASSGCQGVTAVQDGVLVRGLGNKMCVCE